jgi:hypothetical protein
MACFKAMSTTVALTLFLSTGCEARKSPQEIEVAKRYPASLYMYAGARCNRGKVKAVDWPNAELSFGIHRRSIQNLDRDTDTLRPLELYLDGLSVSADDRAAMRDIYSAPVIFTGWVVQCADGSNSVALGNKMVLKPHPQQSEALK